MHGDSRNTIWTFGQGLPTILSMLKIINILDKVNFNQVKIAITSLIPLGRYIKRKYVSNNYSNRLWMLWQSWFELYVFSI